MEKNSLYSFSNPGSPQATGSENRSFTGYGSLNIPQISLPKGGGAIRSIDEKFSVNAANGTSGFSIPFPFSGSRNGFMPGMALGYNSGGGNGTFGLGWDAQPVSITRKTENKLPEYNDEEESDIFMFSGAEDLVSAYNKDGSGNWIKDSSTINGVTITRYKPRLEGGFARIEKITETNGNTYWKSTSPGNVVSVFGKSKTAQVFNPADPSKIYRWLLEFSYDDKGNCFQFEYKKEDKVNIQTQLHEKNRLNDVAAFTNTYLKRIKYCNKNHFNRSSIDLSDWENFLDSIEYLLELVLDYGEHDLSNPQPDDNNGWMCRADPFSEYRSGFEIRTYRLCRRVLMFHRFSELGTAPCLVRSMDIVYNSSGTFTFLQSITQKGYIRKADGSYATKSIPPVEFTYEQLGWDTEVKSLPAASLDNLPTGIDDGYYQWIDLYREGISGVLTEQAGGWYYKSNAGGGNFEGIQLVAPKPSLSGVATGGLHFQDIEGKGQQFLVSNDLQGYYELSNDNEWQPFQHFAEVPNINLRDSNLKYIDLNGDGKADILISEHEVFVWYASKGKEGFDSYKRLQKTFDENKGPNIVFADSTESIVLTDMSGDGLSDIVRIRNGEVSYWPNLGYGRFGAMVSMSNAPVFDYPDNFNPRYIKLADLDGSGTTGIVYLGSDSFKIYFNQSGNSWSEVNVVKGANPLPFAKIDEYASVNVIDLLGNGTGCIVWSSPLPQHAGNQLQYLDLMGGKKPHVMKSYKNNMGKEVNIHYNSSTFYYLEDKKAGTPWVTKLPFPVQCVSKVEMMDLIRKTRFTNHYSYHHGYYDFVEREFRGFGRVDQIDTEDFEQYKKHSNPDGSIQLVDEGFHQPSVLTKTWFHTGAFLDKEKILTQFAHEYYQNAVIPEQELLDPLLPANLTVDEWREGLRACKGLPLRTEVYTPDGSDKEKHPYTTSHHSCLIQLLQPRLQNKFAIFQIQQSESLTYTYERDPADPRIVHSMTIETDEFGNVLKAAAINYGRKTTDANLLPAEQAEQSKIHVIFSESNFTNKIDNGTDYHLPVEYEGLAYELTGLTPDAGDYFSIAGIKNDLALAAVIAHEALPTTGKKEKRLIAHERSVLLKNDLSGPLPLGIMESLGLPHQSFKLSLTPGLRDFIYGDKVSDAMLLNEGRYAHFNDDNYWIASGTQTLDANHFYQSIETTDPFGFKAQVQYDTTYRFFVQKTTDTLNNSSETAGFNFRTLGPYLIKDINDNYNGVRTDELGMVVSTFMMGKLGENKGDLMDTATVEASANDQPTTVVEYDSFNYINNGKPNFAKASARDTHYYDSLQAGKPVLLQINYAYSDGSGGIIMQKIQAEPGIALQENADGTVTEVDTTPNLRWIGNGRTIVNNKGKPVQQYEPYFSTTFEFEDAKQLVERGVTPVITYDAAGRPIRTDLPDGTFIKVEFDSWSQRTFDQNDTVMDSQWYKDRITTPVASIATPEEIAAANKAAAHANTPGMDYLDSLGSNFLSIVDNGAAGKYKKMVETNIEGNVHKVTDARDNVVVQYKYDMLGIALYHTSMDAGENWVFNDVMGKPVCNWDSRHHIFRIQYDALHRPVQSFVQKNNGTEINIDKVIYGESMPNAKQLNLLGKAYRHFDTAGMATNIAYDFKGNLLQSSRQLCSDYKNDIDWNGNPVLEQEVFISSVVFDALNRPVVLTSPDQSIITPTFNEASLLNKVEVQPKGATQKTVFVKDINYDARGQRQSIVYGNNTATSYQYDTKTFRLTQSLTTGKNGTDLLQKLRYTYDPVGNISSVKDEAQQTIFFNNTVVSPSCDYVYDAIYRLINASGREHIGQNQPPSPHDEFRTNLPTPGDGAAMRNYTQSYDYDAVGNMLQMIHSAGSGSWTRTYNYETANNRLKSNTVNNNTETYTHDEHGNIQSLSHLQGLNWNYKDQLQNVNLGGGGIAYYVYDGTGRRMRKVIERQGGIKEERIYLGEFELFRKTDSGGNIAEETETLHVMDNARNIAIVETKIIEDGIAIEMANFSPLMRYQYGNHLGSSSLELDENAVIISYEEYHPYGTTSYEAINATVKAAAKRYRYTGMEKDEESGLAYHGARYYLPWLGRWLNADPALLSDGLNIFQFTHSNPVKFVDPNGKDSKDAAVYGMVESLVPLVYERHSSDGFPKTDALQDKVGQNIIATFVRLGESVFKECSANKYSRLELFDMGVQIFAQRFKKYHVAQLLAPAIRIGTDEYERKQAANLSLHEEYFVDSEGGHSVTIGETKKQAEDHSYARYQSLLQLSKVTGDLIASMGGGGKGGGGRTSGRAPASRPPRGNPAFRSKENGGAGGGGGGRSGSGRPRPEGDVVINGQRGFKDVDDQVASFKQGPLPKLDEGKPEPRETKFGRQDLGGPDVTHSYIAHANTRYIFHGISELSPIQFAQKLIDAGWQGGILRLVTCLTGKGSGLYNNESYAQALSNILNAKGHYTVIITTSFALDVVNGLPLVNIAPFNRKPVYLPPGQGWSYITPESSAYYKP